LASGLYVPKGPQGCQALIVDVTEGNIMQENIITTINELFSAIDEYRGFYFRGEIKDYKKTACLPAYLRDSGKNSSRDAIDDGMLKQKLEELGVGFPYTPPADDDGALSNFKSALTNCSYYWSYLKWGKDKLEALLTHYSPDFKALDKVTKKTGHEYYSRLFESLV
jgi:hypothetical protein